MCIRDRTLSSFLPNLVVRSAMKDLGAGGVPHSANENAGGGAAVEGVSRIDDASLDKMIQAGVKRLLDFQNKDGGWGFWRGDPTDPFLTAYAVWALSLEASLRGVNIPFQAIRGADLLSNLCLLYTSCQRPFTSRASIPFCAASKSGVSQ